MRGFDALSTAGQARRHRVTVRTALSHYGLDVARIRQLAIDTNFVFRVVTTTDETLAVRVMRPWGVPAEVTWLETWFVEELVRRGVPAGPPLATLSGELFTTVAPTAAVPHDHRVVVFRWLAGTAVTEDTAGYWEMLGELAGRLHGVSRQIGVPADGATARRWDSVNYFGEDPVPDAQRALALTPAELAVVDAAIPRLDRLLAEVYERAGEPLRLVHGDLHDGNVIRQRQPAGGYRLAAFDFEDVTLGLPIHDLAVAFYGPYYKRADFPEIVQRMRAGYEPHATWPLRTTDDHDTLKLLCAARALGMIEFCMLLGPDAHHYLERLVARVAAFLDGKDRP